MVGTTEYDLSFLHSVSLLCMSRCILLGFPIIENRSKRADNSTLRSIEILFYFFAKSLLALMMSFVSKVWLLTGVLSRAAAKIALAASSPICLAGT